MRFMIVASPRTGSSHLVNMLSGHPEIFCHGNVFAKKMMPVFWPKAERADPATKDHLKSLRDSDPEAFLEQVFLTGHGREHVGFKIFKGQNNSILNRILKDTAIKKIVLFRKNVLANYASSLAAAASGKWGVRKSETPPETPKVLFEKSDFVKFHDRYLQFYRNVIKRLNNERENFYFVNYEEINDTLLLTSLTNFIGADTSKHVSEKDQRKKQVKQSTSFIVSRFSNPEQAEEFLRDNDLLHWAHEGETSLQLIGENESEAVSHDDLGEEED